MIRLIIILFALTGLGQKIQFKTYSDKKHNFSFDIPENWIVRADSTLDYFIGICDSTFDNEIASYKTCNEGIIFRIELYESDLTKTLETTQMYKKVGDKYTTSDRFSNDVQTEKIKGKNWAGIYHINTCGVTCIDEETNERNVHAAAGQCEFFYFSNNKQTICITTNGSSFDESIRQRILESFKFIE